jgi:hypothetical protein
MLQFCLVWQKAGCGWHSKLSGITCHYTGFTHEQALPCSQVAFVIGGLRRQTSTLKPFNPILGETYEGVYESGVLVYAEQISHHPPISSWQVMDPKGQVRGRCMGPWAAYIARAPGASRTPLYRVTWVTQVSALMLCSSASMAAATGRPLRGATPSGASNQGSTASSLRVMERWLIGSCPTCCCVVCVQATVCGILACILLALLHEGMC